MENYFLNYASLEQQRWMVADKARTDAFAEAIAEVVKPGDVVIDVGAGTGILSMLAARAGASRVIGIEASDMALFAHELIAENGLGDSVEIFHGAAEDVVIEGGVDVIISEWLGHMAYVEDMFRSVLKVRKANLRPGGTMLPADVDLLMAPVDDRQLYHDWGPGFWTKQEVHGLDFSVLHRRELEMGHAKKLEMPADVLLCDGKVFHSLDTVDADHGDEWGQGELEFVVERDGELNGFMGWFQTRLSPGVLLDTSPKVETTHWEQTYFPFHPIAVKKGDTIRLAWCTEDPFEGSRLMEMTLSVGERSIRYIVD
ncbi:MAG: 50S ribosomal protein L11 methyltransferase [Proteobacteria bacterium]|nr:50S ribosomal protein L11 methyltransferase [Pseudomonadota bacterium]